MGGGAEAEPPFICSLEANLVLMCMSRAGLAPPGGPVPSSESASEKDERLCSSSCGEKVLPVY